MTTRPRTHAPLTSKRIFLLLSAIAFAAFAAGTSTAGQNDATTRFSFGTVMVGQDQTIVVRVTYPPLESTRGGTPAPLRVVAAFDLYAVDSGGPLDARGLVVSKHRFVEQRSVEVSVRPGESVSIGLGGEMISGFSASHLSLIGPTSLELTERGITVTGELTTHIGGPTLTILKPDRLRAP